MYSKTNKCGGKKGAIFNGTHFKFRASKKILRGVTLEISQRQKTIYEKIAEKYNTTPEEVRREMQIAIDAGFDNPDPAVQEEWKKMTLKGERPTPEEVINYAVKN